MKLTIKELKKMIKEQVEEVKKESETIYSIYDDYGGIESLVRASSEEDAIETYLTMLKVPRKTWEINKRHYRAEKTDRETINNEKKEVMAAIELGKRLGWI